MKKLKNYQRLTRFLKNGILLILLKVNQVTMVLVRVNMGVGVKYLREEIVALNFFADNQNSEVHQNVSNWSKN